VNVGLTYIDERNVTFPLKAVELPSLEKGTWTLFDDGRMETTWKLRPNIFWHDGTPQTAADYLFAFEVNRDPDLPRAVAMEDQAKISITAPDPSTLVIAWSQPWVDAGTMGPDVMPRHLLGDLYAQDKLGAFINTPYWTYEQVGDGPYRIVRYELGGDMELERFDQYFEGRPPFDRVYVRVIGDASALIASILAGAVDTVVPPGIDIDAALEVKRRWEGTGNEVRADVVERPIHLEIQFRPEVARPQFGLVDQSVRQGLYQAINRQTIAELMAYGFAPLADSWYPPHEPRRAALAIPHFAYDPSVAPRLLAGAGWTNRGPDGVLIHERTGERFSTELWANEAGGWDKLAYAIADDWKPLGVEARVHNIPSSRTGDREYEAGHVGAFVTNVNVSQYWTNRLHSSRIPSAATRWVGNNRGGYVNPQVDVLYDRLVATIPPNERTALEREMVRLVMGGLVIMPFYWETNPVLKLAGVKDHMMRSGFNTWHFFDWDKE
jgi:peptide/nickel transport system substrate-binding protein